jgi:membrane associated rhomboid family serine protease
MGNTDIQKDNRKALPKYLLLLLAGGLVGGVLGFLTGWMGRSSATELVAEGADYALRAVLPWLIPAACIVLLSMAVWRYRQARGLFTAWDGEAEEPVDRADTHLNWALLLSSVAMILDLFLMSIIDYGGESFFRWAAILGFFLLFLAAVVVLQQKVVDLTRRMNPEKQGSVYDPKFRKKWLASCDEAERQQIGQAAYRAFHAATVACPILWALLLFLHISFDIGPLPAFTVLLLFAILQVSYCLECIRLGRKEQ